MSRDVHRDTIAVINGPEDGNLYPIVKPPCFVGSDISCGVQIRLDRSVQGRHVMLTPANGGYRVRCLTTVPAFVNGRRVGQFHSLVLCPGGELRVGYTTLTLKAPADGLAQRFRGVDLHGDLSWTLRLIGSTTRSAVSGVVSLLTTIFGGLLRHWKIAIPLGLVIGYAFVPPVRNLILWAIYYIRVALGRCGIYI